MYYLKNTNFWMFGLFFFFYFFIMGAYFPFFPIWLHDINHISKFRILLNLIFNLLYIALNGGVIISSKCISYTLQTLVRVLSAQVHGYLTGSGYILASLRGYNVTD